MRKMIFSLVVAGLMGALAGPAFAGPCDSKMTDLKPMMAKVTDAGMKTALEGRWTQAEAAMKANDDKACMEHLAFIERALRDGKM
ncbi:MAG: hypothetical protein IT561_28520 [Alphaproteobacteria bacterium]|nr:hypothetical protein [Alphaproteobacteria bacterium]